MEKGPKKEQRMLMRIVPENVFKEGAARRKHNFVSLNLGLIITHKSNVKKIFFLFQKT